MMPASQDNFKILDELQRRQRKRLFTFSPNDALVQISLPLVLILAIATRLMIVSQSLSAQDQGPVILDLWKQQLILRIDRVMEDWERAAQLAAFPEFERIQWGGGWPGDTRFAALCEKARELDDLPALTTGIYHAALSYRPDELDPSSVATLYDPQSPIIPENADKIPSQFRIDAERRQYALDYIRERCLQWRDRIEALQWSVVARCAAELPVNDELADAEIAAQAAKLAGGLAERGYPLLESITSEYRKD
jgi:hypothetical protein